jgi:hypothetical protein
MWATSQRYPTRHQYSYDLDLALNPMRRHHQVSVWSPFSTQCATLSLDPRTRPRNFCVCVNGLRQWEGLQTVRVVIGMPLDCLLRPLDQCSLEYPHSSASIPPLVMADNCRRGGGDTTSPMHRQTLSLSSPPYAFPHVPAQAQRAATPALCESAHEQATEPTTRSTPAYYSPLRVRARSCFGTTHRQPVATGPVGSFAASSRRQTSMHPRARSPRYTLNARRLDLVPRLRAASFPDILRRVGWALHPMLCCHRHLS